MMPRSPQAHHWWGLAIASTVVVMTAVAGPARAQSHRPADVETMARNFFPADERSVPPARLYRLTRDQIDATASALLPGLKLKSIKAFIARDPLQTNYEYADLLALNAANMGGITAWSAEIAKLVKANPNAVISCAATDEACLTARARAFAIKAYRGDAAAERLDKLSAFYSKSVKDVGHAQATADFVEIILNSPDFLFRKEINTISNERLSTAQLLQAVTYTITDHPPELAGVPTDKADRALSSGAEAATTITTLLQSKAARAKLSRFIRAWLEVRDPSEFTISTNVFPEFKPAYAAGLVRDTEQFLATQLAKPAPTLKDIMQSVTVEPGRQLASADPIAAKIAEADAVSRMGVLTSPAVIASHSGPTNTRPIKRGVFWARKVMCMEMEPPPPDLHAKIYDIEGATERQRIEQSTKGAACIGCHKVINPLGFFLEGYDALGRLRATDNGQPVDTSILIDFLDEKPRKTQTAVEAIAALTNSNQFKQCFVRQMFRYYMGRQEVPADDAVLRRMFVTLVTDDEQDIQKTLFQLVSSDRIVRRK